MKHAWKHRVAIALVGALSISAAAAAQTGPQLEIPLTLADAVKRAVEHNPDLEIVRLDTEAEAAKVGASRSAYAPVFSTLFGRTRTVSPPTNYLLGDAGVDVKDWFSSTGVAQRVPWGGGTWSVSWDAARTTTNSLISSFDPNLLSGVQFAFSQPLVRDRKIDQARQQYMIARRNRDSSELKLRESAVQTVASVKRAYWTLKATIANIGVQQRSLDLAQELARQNRIRVDAGQIPPLDLVQAEAEVTERRNNLIQARTLAGDAEDRLRRLIIDPGDTAFWATSFQLLDEPEEIGAAPDVDSAVAHALASRFDLGRAKHDLENADTNVEFLGNQRLPDVRLETSYRGSGLGGTQFLRTGGFPGIVTGTRDRSFGDALGQAFASDYPTWSVGVTVSYPLGHSYEEANLARADVERRQAAQRIASLRLDTAEAVRRAARQVQSTAERADAARATATLAERRTRDEQRRFDVGLSTTFLVTQAQRDLLQAQVSLLQTILDHQSALVDFETVQQAPPPGSNEAVGIRGADIVQLSPSTPRGLFRPNAGQ
jgi:outer membrane protein TolC